MATGRTGRTSWTERNMACVAAYNILENDLLLNQFEDIHVPFAGAGSRKLSDVCAYFPKFPVSPMDLRGRAHQMARQYLIAVVKNYTGRKEDRMLSAEEALMDFTALFESDKATLLQLAQATDDVFRFKDE